jgi:hypothetical protein
MGIEQFKIGDAFTMDHPDIRWRVRAWCWLTRKPLPTKRTVYRVTHITSAGGLVSVR